MNTVTLKIRNGCHHTYDYSTFDMGRVRRGVRVIQSPVSVRGPSGAKVP